MMIRLDTNMNDDEDDNNEAEGCIPVPWMLSSFRPGGWAEAGLGGEGGFYVVNHHWLQDGGWGPINHAMCPACTSSGLKLPSKNPLTINRSKASRSIQIGP